MSQTSTTMNRCGLIAGYARCALACLGMALLSSCSSPSVDQPSGSPVRNWRLRLQKQNELPGFSKGEHGTVSYELSSRDLSVTFPVTRSFTASKHGETAVYHFAVYRGSEETGWKLQRAWRTSADGTVVTEFPLP